MNVSQICRAAVLSWLALAWADAGAADAPASAASAVAADGGVAPGEYVTERGWGVLKVAPGGGDRKFSVDAVGANAHMCQFDGQIHELVARVDPGVEGEPCVIRFRPTGGGVSLTTDTDDACHLLCGARAYFPGDYFLAPVTCAEPARRKASAEFGALYLARDYAGAYARLRPQLDTCDRFLDREADGQLRNDLAVTLFHLARPADCRAVLAPLIAAHATTEAGLRSELPPTDFEDFLPVARAAWHNDKLCAGH